MGIPSSSKVPNKFRVRCVTGDYFTVTSSDSTSPKIFGYKILDTSVDKKEYPSIQKAATLFIAELKNKTDVPLESWELDFNSIPWELDYKNSNTKYAIYV